MHEPLEILPLFSDEALEDIIENATDKVREGQQMLHSALAEKARRRLGVSRVSEEDIA